MAAAMTKMKTPYPKSLTLTSRQDLIAACKNRGVVIKCDFSDSTTCIFLPSSDERSDRRMEKILWKYTETERLYEGIECLPHPMWMAQPLIPSLVQKGEIRAFVVRGKMVHAIHTWP
jgi:glutathione synthase/RimK-type ligase-like ATP-grasp enzyme